MFGYTPSDAPAAPPTMPIPIAFVRRSHLGSLLLVLLALSACRTAHMPLPEPLASVDPMPVHGRQGWKISESLRFGPYEVHAIDRSWVRGRDLRLGAAAWERRSQQYAFTLSDGAELQWQVACEAHLRRTTLEERGLEVALSDRSSLRCTLRDPAAARPPWTLALAETHEAPLQGTVAGGRKTLDVVGTARLQGGTFAGSDPTGYEIRTPEKALAAVEVLNAGTVWMVGGALPSDRAVFAAIAAALLLLEDLRGHLNEPAS